MKSLAIALLCLLCVSGFLNAAGWLDLKNTRQERDAAKAAESIWQSRYAEAATRTAKRDTLWRQAKARVDSIRDTIPLWRHDTTYITEYVARTDTALAACHELSNACATFRRVADSTIRVKDLRIASLRPSRWDRVKPYVIGAGAFWLGTKFQK